MHRPTLALALALALVLGAAADSRPACSVSGSKTVASNSAARVYTVQSRRADYGDVLLGCLRSNGLRVRLAENYDDGLYQTSVFSKVRLNGRFIVWELDSTDVSCKADCPPGYNPTTYAVQVGDLRRRRIRGFAGRAKDALFVTPAGTPAWLEDAGTAVEVHAGANVLDSGPIDSLALTGNVLSWLNAGTPRSATLR